MSLVRNISNIQSLLEQECLDLRELINRAVESDIDLLNKVNDHLFLSSGKMIRPVLSMLTAKACTGSVSYLAMVCSAASELIHTATLLHDDVVDNSINRRGQMTVNALFSSGTSVLMGDFWLSRAINLLIKNNCSYVVLGYFSKTIEDLAEGEMLQMQRADDLKTTLDDYINIISRKTASLFVTAMCSVAETVNATSQTKEAIYNYAYNLGLSFQMRDDILDYSDSPLDGKDVGSDIAERKITLPLICALDSCSDFKQSTYIRTRISSIDILQKPEQEPNSSIIAEVNGFVFLNNGVEKAKLVLNDYISKATLALDVIPISPYKDALISIAKELGL